MANKFDAFVHVREALESCKSELHVKQCQKLIKRFHKIYQDKELTILLRHVEDKICKRFEVDSTRERQRKYMAPYGGVLNIEDYRYGNAKPVGNIHECTTAELHDELTRRQSSATDKEHTLKGQPSTEQQ